MTEATQPTKAIVTQSLSKQVDLADNPLVILSDINIEINTGESFAIVGTSGSGKSTLLGLLAGLDTPSSGSVTLAGENISHMDEDARALLRAKRVGFVFQSFQLLPNLTALENTLLPLEVLGHKNPQEKAKAMLNDVGLSERLNHYPKQLSGGEQQRAALARAFVTKPDILFADEPTGNLDTKTGEHIANLLFDLNRQNNTTLVLVTHDLKLAQRCQRTIHLEAGQLVEGEQ